MRINAPTYPTEFISRANGLEISVWPEFDEDKSKIETFYFMFNYIIRINNKSESKVQLLERFWRIEDAYGNKNEVSGEGVVGLKPKLNPGEDFVYQSFCPLRTSTGKMEGRFKFQNESNESFDFKINEFLFRNITLIN